jgi:hypothetical protein
MPSNPAEQAPTSPAEHQTPNLRSERMRAFARAAAGVILKAIIEYVLSQLC